MSNYAGLVSMRRSRKTGTRVGIYKGEEAGLDTDGGTMPWSTVCEEHSAVVTHRTRKDATLHAPHPDEWCEQCQRAIGHLLGG